MARHRQRRRAGAADERAVITVVISDDDDDDEGDNLQATHADQQQPEHDSPAFRTRAAGTAAQSPTAGCSPGGQARGAAAHAAAAAQPAAAAAAAGGHGAGSDSDADGSDNCIICMDLMSEAGSHRPAALKCGHIFGDSCIRKWLRAKPKCPQCNKSARCRDITTLFNLPKKVAAGCVPADLEQQLQEAQRKAAEEHKRAEELQKQLKAMSESLSRVQQQQPQVPTRFPPPPPPLPYQQRQQQQHEYHPLPQQGMPLPPLGPRPDLHWASGPRLPNMGWPVGVNPLDQLWCDTALRVAAGISLTAAEWAAFLQHPNTVACFGEQQVSHLQHDMQQLQAQRMQLPQFQGPRPYAQQQQQQQPPFMPSQPYPRPGQQLSGQPVLQQQQQQQGASSVGQKRPHEQGLGPQYSSAAAAAGGVGGGGGPGRPVMPAAMAAAAAAQARADAAAATAGGGGSGQQQMLKLALMPIHATTAAAGASAASSSSTQLQAAGVHHMPGSFSVLQEYAVQGSRVFDLDADATLLVVAEAPQAFGGSSRLRRVSMAAPGSPAFVMLPAQTGTIRALARQPATGGGSSSSALMAVGSDRGGLIIAKPATNNTIAVVPTQAPVWSVAWSTSNDQQLLLGLDKGRVAQVDLRMSGSRALLLVTGTPGSSGSGSSGAAGPPAAAAAPLQPWHSLLALPQDWQQQHAGTAAAAGEGLCTPEVLLACPAGVYCWSSAQPQDFQLLLPSSLHGGQCESLSLAPDGTTIAASFRTRVGNSSLQAAHWLCRLAAEPQGCSGTGAAAGLVTGAAAAAGTAGGGVAGAMAAGRQQLLSSTLRLSGHSSMMGMTRGCFLPQLPNMPGETLLFASADEASCEPRVWGCSSGLGLQQAQPWAALSSPVLQVSGGVARSYDTTLLAVLGEQQLKVYMYA